MGAQFRIITSGVQHEIDKIKGSRFIGTVQALEDAAALDAALQPLRRTWPDANHHCWAWRIGRSRDHFRYSDDGEPSGSAGRPILQQIEGRHLTNILVVVTRIFGGTKLGVGGLVRAYGDAAAAALDRCPQEEWIIRKRLRLTYAYDLDGIIKALLQQADLQAESIDYDTQVHQTVAVPEDDVDALCQQLRERTAARIDIQIL